ncbi:MAG TPA: toll/interleukin-1 receptor domain-containing protein [Xanthobacteraceae bacterium]|nr:toll/interleukin-1 receptor domain-containing protein [Xanthobacteraceae bacterium]
MIFISYAREDHAYACDLYRALHAAGLDPWMDKPPPPFEHLGIQVGQRWRAIIEGRLRQADLVVLLLSPRSVRKRGNIAIAGDNRRRLCGHNIVDDSLRFGYSERIKACSSEGTFRVRPRRWSKCGSRGRSRKPLPGGLGSPPDRHNDRSPRSAVD